MHQEAVHCIFITEKIAETGPQMPCLLDDKITIEK